MIDFASWLRRSASERVKAMLRWLLCASVTDRSGVSSDSFVEVRTEQMEVTETWDSERLVTFQKMPAECKLLVFSYLTIEEKGRAERVCTEWRDLIRTPLLWKSVDLTQLSLRCRCPGHGCTDPGCYDSYKERTEQLLDYLIAIRPNLTEFRFAFDIIDTRDDWLRLLRGFIDSVRVEDLRLVELNWKETPVKPHPSENATWSSNTYNDLMYRHRRRQRHFIGFFDYFTASAPNLSTLILPFDWSVPSIRFLRRLLRLESLILESYFVPQPFHQETLDDLVSAVPNVKHLSLAVCVMSGAGVAAYRLASKRLRSLDLSRCQGFGLEEVRLPSLTKFRTCRWPHAASPFPGTASTAVPCIYAVLRAGAPALLQINDHRLRVDWRETKYPDLDSVLHSICACPLHSVCSLSEDLSTGYCDERVPGTVMNCSDLKATSNACF